MKLDAEQELIKTEALLFALEKVLPDAAGNQEAADSAAVLVDLIKESVTATQKALA